MDQRRRLQVDLKPGTLNGLDDLAHELRKKSQDRRFGAGTIAAQLLESLLKHPEIIHSLLEEYANQEHIEPKENIKTEASHSADMSPIRKKNTKK